MLMQLAHTDLRKGRAGPGQERSLGTWQAVMAQASAQCEGMRTGRRGSTQNLPWALGEVPRPARTRAQGRRQGERLGP